MNIKQNLTIYIQTNPQQLPAAKVSKYSFERFGFKDVNILELNKIEAITKYFYKEYKRNGKTLKYDPYDLQSFTPIRFYPPAIQKKGFALVIAPDIFALKKFNIFSEKSLNDLIKIYCTKKNNRIKSEVMLINCENFNLWNFDDLISDLFQQKIDYSTLINLDFIEKSKIGLINENFNSHDQILNETILLHTTNRITQPWKVGLEIDYSYNISKFNIIKNYIRKKLRLPYNKKLLEKNYQKHGNPLVIKCITSLFKEALTKNFISKNELEDAVRKKFVSKEFLSSF